MQKLLFNLIFFSLETISFIVYVMCILLDESIHVDCRVNMYQKHEHCTCNLDVSTFFFLLLIIN